MPRTKKLEDSAAIYGLSIATVARQVNVHPSTVIRWILNRKTLRSGQVIQLLAMRTPGGWRIKPEDLDAYLEAITRDRLGEADAAPPSRTPCTRSRALARADRELAEAGI